MGILEWIFSTQTAFGFLLALGLWVAGKIIDLALERVLDRKIISPLVDSIRWRIRAFLTRMNPISATFEISFTPRREHYIGEIRGIVVEAFEKCEENSKNRIDIDPIAWNESSDGPDGHTEASHVDSKHPFRIDIHLEPNIDDVQERPDVDYSERVVEKINFRIGFRFPFRQLSDTLTNLSAFARFFEKGMTEVLNGSFSDGQFIIHPIDSELTLDEWIEEEGLQVSLLLAGEEPGQTEVEFFPDHAEIHPPYLEMDSEVIRYVRLMILNYYLRKE